MQKLLILLILCTKLNSQNDSLLIKAGSQAPSFILTLPENTIQSFGMPYLKRIVLLHFWSSSVPKSRNANKYLDRLADRYKNTIYRNATGFEIISIGVQTDKNDWMDAIKKDSLTNFTHGLAKRGYLDEVCIKYGVTSLPTDILIDENGIIVGVNPRIMDIENLLDERRDVQPIKKDVVGKLAQSSNKSETIKYCSLFLLNYYGDSIQKTLSSDKGEFKFTDVKLNQDFVIKIDNQVDINTSDPIAIYTLDGEFMMDGRTKNNGFLFYIPAKTNFKLTVADSGAQTNYLGQIHVIKHLTFFTDGSGLTPQDQKELNAIITILEKNKSLKVEVTTHTDGRTDKDYALMLTTKQADAIKAYLEKRGITADRIQASAKGNSELRKICDPGTDCREEDHQLNRRVEFLLFKD